MHTNNAKLTHRLLENRAFRHVITLPQQRIHCEHSWSLNADTQIHDIETVAICEGRIQPIEFCNVLIEMARAWALDVFPGEVDSHIRSINKNLDRCVLYDYEVAAWGKKPPSSSPIDRPPA